MAKKALPSGFSRRTRTNKKTGTVSEFLEYRFMVDGERFSVYGQTVKECKDKELKKREEKKLGLLSANPTFEEYYKKQYLPFWLKTVKPKESTQYINASRYNQIIELIGSKKIKDIGPADCRKLQAAFADKYSASYANDMMIRFKTVMQSAVDDELIAKNPCNKLKAVKRDTAQEPLATETIHKALSLEEQTLFFNSAKESYYYPLFLILVYTGMRIGEACALKWYDISDDVIHVQRSTTRDKDGTYIIGDSTKTYTSKRDIPLTDEAKRALALQKKQNTIIHGFECNDLIFRAFRGDLLHPRTANENIAKICNTAGMRKFTVHCFRDTFATRMIENGMNPKTLQKILGHKNIAMTMNLYAQVTKKTAVDEMQKASFVV